MVKGKEKNRNNQKLREKTEKGDANLLQLLFCLSAFNDFKLLAGVINALPINLLLCECVCVGIPYVCVNALSLSCNPFRAAILSTTPPSRPLQLERATGGTADYVVISFCQPSHCHGYLSSRQIDPVLMNSYWCIPFCLVVFMQDY